MAMATRVVTYEEVLSWLEGRVKEYRQIERTSRVGKHGNDDFWRDRAEIAEAAIVMLKATQVKQG